MLSELRYSLRMLGKSPVFTCVAVVSLALGIGANTTVFTIVNGVLLRGLPFKDPEAVVSISEFDRPKGIPSGPAGVSYPDLLDLKARNRSVTDLAAFSTGTYNINDDVSSPERVIGNRVTTNLFSVIGQQPLLGRDFAAGEEEREAELVVIIGYGIWQSRYGGASDILGRTLRSNGVAHKIIGVMPRGMRFPAIAEIWFPMAPPVTLDRSARGTDVFGRLRDNVSLQQARMDLSSIAQSLALEYPETNKDIDVLVRPYAEQFSNPQTRNVLTALIGAVGFVLLIVCANLSNLLLARAVHRTRETAIRLAIGAGRWQVARHLVLEALLLSFTGGLLGLGLSVFGVRFIGDAAKGVRLPYWIDLSIDYRVALYFVAVSFAAGIVFSLAPAWKISRTPVNDRLKDSSGGSTGPRPRRLTSLLVTCQVALTVILLAGSGLMIRSLLKFHAIDMGVTTKDMLFANLILPSPKYAKPSDRIAFAERFLEQLPATPELRRATLASHSPAGGAWWRKAWIEDLELPEVATIVVAPGYFEAIGAIIVRGRDFTQRDGLPGNKSAIVNTRFASQQWPGEDPLGKRIRLNDRQNAPWLTVVGVSPNVRVEDEPEFQPAVYVPYRQDPGVALAIIATPGGSREIAIRALRAEIQKLDSDLPIFNVMTMEDFKEQLSVGLRILGSLFSVFAAIALLISTIGVYAVTSYSVSQRTEEIGIRMALGATGRSVAWLVARQSLLQLGAGLTLGLIGAAATTRLIAAFMFQTTPTDGLTFFAILLLLSMATLAACLIPAMRAASIDPASALRPL